jgi:hypothetical protein
MDLEIESNSNLLSTKQSNQKIDEMILKELIKNQELSHFDNLVPDLANHIKQFFDSKKNGAKNRKGFKSENSQKNKLKKNDLEQFSMRESIGKSSGRTQNTEVKKHKWIWKGREETNPSHSNDKESISKGEVESLMNIEEMNGIREFQRKVNKGNMGGLKQGIEIKGRVRKKNRYSVPVKKNVFGNEPLRIEEESEEFGDSYNEEKPDSQRNLEESLKVLKEHLVKEIQEDKNKSKKIEGFQFNLYSGRFVKKQTDQVNKHKNLQEMLKDVVIKEKSKNKMSKNKSTKSWSRKRITFAEKDLKEPQTRKLFYNKDQEKMKKASNLRMKKNLSLQKSISFDLSKNNMLRLSPKNTLIYKKYPNQDENKLKSSQNEKALNKVLSNSTWEVSKASGFFQNSPVPDDHTSNVFNRLFNQTKKLKRPIEKGKDF